MLDGPGIHPEQRRIQAKTRLADQKRVFRIEDAAQSVQRGRKGFVRVVRVHVRPQRVGDLVATHVLAAERHQNFKKFHRPSGALAGKLDGHPVVQQPEVAEHVDAERPRPFAQAQGRPRWWQLSGAYQGADEFGLDPIGQRQHAHLSH